MSEFFTFYGVTWHHARLQRPCCECGIQIERKERYQRLSGCFEGEWFNYSTCEPCAKIRDEFFPGTFTVTELLESLMDMRDELSYDNVRQWALLTNAIADLRQRQRAALALLAGPPVPALTPTHLFAVRKS